MNENSLHRSASLPDSATFFVHGGYDEKEAAIAERLAEGWRKPESCFQTCVFGKGYWLTLLRPLATTDYEI